MSTKIFLIDQGIGAEAIAAIQSYYSRDPGSAYSHVQKALVEDPAEFLRKYYKKGYAHKSIAQCSTITIFIEGVSILAAKAIQDSPFYNGQEASTRYINFAEQGFANPSEDAEIQYCASDIIESAKLGQLEELLQWLDIEVDRITISDKKVSAESEAIKDAWMGFYTDNFQLVTDYLKSKNPIAENQKADVYEKAIYARTCDVLRGFLPAGMKTLLSWHTTLDHVNDMLKVLKYHPATEVREISLGILKALIKKYPETFVEETAPEIEDHLKLCAQKLSYYEPNDWKVKPGDIDFNTSRLSRRILEDYSDVIRTRPRKGLAHRMLGRAGLIDIKYLLDYGGVRDILRHRPGINQVPLLTTEYGFENWYIDELPQGIRRKARDLIIEQVARIRKTPLSKYDRQYLIPLGFLAPMYHSWPFNQMIYIPELRTGATVHPTVQKPMRGVAMWLHAEFEEILGTAFYPSIDDSGGFSYKRGTQTIDTVSTITAIK